MIGTFTKYYHDTCIHEEDRDDSILVPRKAYIILRSLRFIHSIITSRA